MSLHHLRLERAAQARTFCLALMGREPGVSVACVALRVEPTGAPTGFRADTVATAKHGLAQRETLDGEGGYAVYGKLMPAADSMRLGGLLSIGLAHSRKLLHAVPKRRHVTWSDVDIADDDAVRIRRELDRISTQAG